MQPGVLTTCPVVITGVSRGLGRAFLELLQTTARPLVCVGRSLPEGLDGDNVRFVSADLASWRGDRLLVDLPPEREGLVFISNAGTVQPTGRAGTLDPAAVEHAMRLNVTAPALLCNELLASTEPAAPLHVVNISTGAAVHALPGLSVYGAGKAAARMFFDCVAKESERVTVSHVDPGAVDTDMQSYLRSQAVEALPVTGVFEEYARAGKLRTPLEAAREVLTAEGLL